MWRDGHREAFCFSGFAPASHGTFFNPKHTDLTHTPQRTPYTETNRIACHKSCGGLDLGHATLNQIRIDHLTAHSIINTPTRPHAHARQRDDHRPALATPHLLPWPSSSPSSSHPSSHPTTTSTPGGITLAGRGRRPRPPPPLSLCCLPLGHDWGQPLPNPRRGDATTATGRHCRHGQCLGGVWVCAWV